MNKTKTAVLLALLLLDVTILPAQKLVDSQLVFPPQEKHVHSSSIVACPNGDLLACWFEGSGERSADDVRIRGARLIRGAKSWSPVFEMADTPDYPDCNPVLFLDNEQRLVLIWAVVRANRWEAAELKYRISNDFQKAGPPQWQWQDIILLKNKDRFRDTIREGFDKLPSTGHTWAEYAPEYERLILESAADAVKREMGWMPRIAPTILPGGRILLPLYSDGFNLSLIAISDDNGATWRPSAPIVGRGNVQPVIFRRKSAELLALMRDNGNPPGRIMQSSSRDNGETWSPVMDIDLPNPGASIAGLVLENGVWCLVFNDQEEGRFNLSLALSRDEGRSWVIKMIIEKSADEKNQFSYPAIIQSADGRIHLTYTWRRDKKSIKHVILDEIHKE